MLCPPSILSGWLVYLPILVISSSVPGFPSRFPYDTHDNFTPSVILPSGSPTLLSSLAPAGIETERSTVQDSEGAVAIKGGAYTKQGEVLCITGQAV